MNDAWLDGLLVIDKPLSVTSRDVVNRVQRWFPRRTRLGHTGTLDPLATGVLVLCVGSATRLTEYIQQMGKTYHTTIRLGATSVTDDGEGPIRENAVARVPTQAALEDVLTHFLGEIEQLPPAFSAAKVAGQRSYDRARRGESVTLTPRVVRIDALRIRRYEYPELDLQVDCGKGTYIRALARDLGEQLGCGGYVQTLRRTRVGPFTPEQAVALELSPAEARGKMLPLTAALAELPPLTLSADLAKGFCQGQIQTVLTVSRPGEHAILDETNTLLGIGICDVARRQLSPVKVLRSARE